ncbi:MAG TPA: O-antigen ligase family protein [Cryobacterium sp.]|nr:O-antigen ligase family protein [Cryobacterium sp.]
MRHVVTLSRSWGTASFVALCAVFVVAGVVAGRLVAAPSTQVLTLAGSAALIYFALFVWQPAAAVLAYIALRPLVDAFVFQQVAGFTLGELWGLGMVLSACLYLLLENADDKDKLKLPAAPIAFLFFVLMLSITRPPLTGAITSWTKIASWILVMLVCERISRNARGQRMTWWTGIAMGAMLTLAVTVMIRQHRYGSAFYANWGTGLKLGGQLPHALSMAAVLLLPFALVGVMFIAPRILSLAISAGLLMAIFLSYVRTALLGSVVVLAALLVLAFRFGGRIRTAGIAVAAGVGVAVFIARDRILQRFSDLTLLSSSGATQSEAGSGRMGIWSTYLDHAFDNVVHTLVGRGANAAELLGVTVFGRQSGAHNDTIELLLSGGVVLVACFIVLIVWMAATPVRTLRDPEQSQPTKAFAALALGAVLAFALMSQLNGIVFYQSSVVIGLVVGLVRGMAATPGETFLDLDPAAETQPADIPSTRTGT